MRKTYLIKGFADTTLAIDYSALQLRCGRYCKCGRGGGRAERMTDEAGQAVGNEVFLLLAAATILEANPRVAVGIIVEDESLDARREGW